MKPLRRNFPGVISSLFFILLISSCTTVDLYEKSVSIPGHAWKSDYKPVFEFTIKDTTTPYQVYLVLRHTDRYSFNNIYVNLYIKGPGQDTATKIQQDLKLASNEEGWLGSGMDDIYEQRHPLGNPITLKAGTYQFTVEHLMREDPLENVLNVGLRVEKK